MLRRCHPRVRRMSVFYSGILPVPNQRHLRRNSPSPAIRKYRVRYSGLVSSLYSELNCYCAAHARAGHVGKFGMPGQGPTAGASVGGGVIHDGTSKTGATGSAHAQRKPRRRLERELNLAARHRRQMAAENYYLHPPKAEDIWICEFCEYERIFGEPPRALIRDYELKDRRHRKEEADRKRLLEKAKAKSRKGKKSGKTPSRGGQGQSRYPEPESTPEVGGEHEAVPLQQGLSHSTQSEEEEYEDDYEDDYSSSAPQRQRGTADGEAEALPVRTKV